MTPFQEAYKAHLARQQQKQKPTVWLSPFGIDMLACLLVVITCWSSVDQQSAVRYAIYGVPMLYLGGWLFRGLRSSYIKPDSFKCYASLVASLLYPAAISPTGDYQYVGLMTIGYSLLVLRLRCRFMTVILLFALLLALQVILSVEAGISVENLLHFNFSTHDYQEVTHTLPFLFGALLGALLLKRRYVLAIFAVAGVLLGGKRIVVLAAIGSLLMQVVHSRFARRYPRFGGIKSKMMFAGIIIGMVIGVGLEMQNITETISMRYGYNPNVFAQGRYETQRPAYAFLAHEDTASYLLGNGLGRADAIASKQWGWKNPIHNDVLRIVLDLGVVFGVVFVFSLMLLIVREDVGIFALCYSALMWCTDNTLIYPFFHIVLSLIILAFRQAEHAAAPRQPSSVSTPAKHSRGRLTKRTIKHVKP